MTVLESPEYEAIAVDKDGNRVAVCPHGLCPENFLSWEPCGDFAKRPVGEQQRIIKRAIASVRMFGVQAG